MVDIELIVRELRNNGHTVEDVHEVPPNAGEYILVVDGNGLNLDEAREVLERDSEK